MTIETSHWTGAPWKAEDKKAFEDTILNRFNDFGLEKAVEFMDRVIERQLIKSSGLLTFNSILIGVVHYISSSPNIWANIATYLSMVSCLPLLSMMYVKWGPATAFTNAEIDVRRACKICFHRAHLLTISLGLSVAAVIISILTI